jgi:lysophospholipase L1-like esterase
VKNVVHLLLAAMLSSINYAGVIDPVDNAWEMSIDELAGFNGAAKTIGGIGYTMDVSVNGNLAMFTVSPNNPNDVLPAATNYNFASSAVNSETNIGQADSWKMTVTNTSRFDLNCRLGCSVDGNTRYAAFAVVADGQTAVKSVQIDRGTSGTGVDWLKFFISVPAGPVQTYSFVVTAPDAAVPEDGADDTKRLDFIDADGSYVMGYNSLALFNGTTRNNDGATMPMSVDKNQFSLTFIPDHPGGEYRITPSASNLMGADTWKINVTNTSVYTGNIALGNRLYYTNGDKDSPANTSLSRTPTDLVLNAVSLDPGTADVATHRLYFYIGIQATDSELSFTVNVPDSTRYPFAPSYGANEDAQPTSGVELKWKNAWNYDADPTYSEVFETVNPTITGHWVFYKAASDDFNDVTPVFVDAPDGNPGDAGSYVIADTFERDQQVYWRVVHQINGAALDDAGNLVGPVWSFVTEPDQTMNDPNVYYGGANYIVNDKTAVRFYRHSEDVLAMTQLESGISSEKARTSTGIFIEFTTDSADVGLIFKYDPDNTKNAEFAVYENGSLASTLVFDQNSESFMLNISSATGTDISHFVVSLPSLSIVELTKFTIEQGAHLLANPTQTRRTMVVMGDSISHGTGQGSASYLTYPWILSRQLDVELYNIAVGGGKIAGTEGQVPQAEMLRDEFSQIDFLVMLIGYNDWNGRGDSMETYHTNYINFLSTVRTNHPDTKIFCITQTYTTTAVSSSTGIPVEEMRDVVRGVVAERQAAGDEKIYLIEGANLTTGADLNDAVHLNIPGANNFANELFAVMDPIVNSGISLWDLANDDGQVNLADLAVFSQDWQVEYDLADLHSFCEHWLASEE